MAAFFGMSCSEKNLPPKNMLNKLESWNKARAEETVKCAKTILVKYCIRKIEITRKICSFKFSLFNGWAFHAGKHKRKEKSNPDKTQKQSAISGFVRRIIFLIKIASVPEKINAKKR